MSSNKKSNQIPSKENENKKSDSNEDNTQPSVAIENQNFARALSKKTLKFLYSKKKSKKIYNTMHKCNQSFLL